MSSHAHLMGLDLAQAPVTLTGSCGRDPGIACRLVWDVSHSGAAARLTAVYLAGPANLVLKLAWLVFLALVARALVHRLINRVTIRAADTPLHTRLRQSTGVRVRHRLRETSAPARARDHRDGAGRGGPRPDRHRHQPRQQLRRQRLAGHGRSARGRIRTKASAGPRARVHPPQRLLGHDLRHRHRDRSR